MGVRLAAVALIASTACSAGFAATTNWGAHDVPVEVGVNSLVPVGSFSDGYEFTLASAFDVTSSAVANNISQAMPAPLSSISVLNISKGTYSLNSAGGDGLVGTGDDVSLGTWAFNGTTGSTSNTVANLGAGKYFYTVSGIADGVAGGSYLLASTIQAVPEPETYAMFLAGLMTLGFVSARRRRG